MLTGLLAVPALADGPIEILEHALDSDITPHSVAFSPVGSEAEGTLWFTDNAGGSLFEFDPGSPEVEATEIFLGEGSGPRGVAAGADAIWVAGYDNDTLYKVTLGEGEGAPVVEAVELGTLPGVEGSRLLPSYIALSGDGQTAWVTLTGDDRLLGFSTEGEFTAESLVKNYPTSANTLPTQIVEGADGRLWYSTQSYVRHGVGALDPETGIVSDYPVPSVGAMMGIAAADDYVYVTSFTHGLVYGIAMDGTIPRPPVALREGSQPRAIAIGEDNTGAASTAWVVEAGTPGVVQGAIAQIDLREGVLVSETDLPTSDAWPANIAADPMSSEFWGTARAASSLFSFSHTDIVTHQLTATEGNNGWAVSGDRFEDRLAATATVGGATPVVGATVTFTIEGTDRAWFDGGGSTATAVTDELGVARVAEFINTAPGLTEDAVFTVTASTFGAAPAIFTQTIGARVEGLEANSPLEASARVRATFAQRPSVLVTNAAGTAMVGAPVTFSIPDGLATFAPGSEQSVSEWTTTTGPDGVATAPPVVAGTAKGRAQINVTSPTYAGAVEFGYWVTGAPAQIETPRNQGVAPGEHGVFEVTLRDQDGDPVRGETITAMLFPLELEGVTLPDDSAVLEMTTDADGKVFFGALGDGSDTFTVAPTVAPGLAFAVLLHTAQPQALTAGVTWRVDPGR